MSSVTFTKFSQGINTDITTLPSKSKLPAERSSGVKAHLTQAGCCIAGLPLTALMVSEVALCAVLTLMLVAIPVTMVFPSAVGLVITCLHGIVPYLSYIIGGVVTVLGIMTVVGVTGGVVVIKRRVSDPGYGEAKGVGYWMPVAFKFDEKAVDNKKKTKPKKSKCDSLFKIASKKSKSLPKKRPRSLPRTFDTSNLSSQLLSTQSENSQSLLKKRPKSMVLSHSYVDLSTIKNKQAIVYSQGYIDTSTLKNGNIAYLYNAKSPHEHHSISHLVALSVVPSIVARMAYNVIRACVIPFFIGGVMVVEAVKGKPCFTKIKNAPTDADSYCFLDIAKQVLLSVKRVFTAPFYGSAFLLATLYSHVAPMNGRKLASTIARECLNEGVELYKGVWTTLPLKDFRFEGGGSAQNLGKHSHYTAGCWQPVAKIKFKTSNGKLEIIEAKSPSGQTDLTIYY